MPKSRTSLSQKLAQTPSPRFGVRVPVYDGPAARHEPELGHDILWERNRNLILSAEALGFDSALISQHLASPQGSDRDQLETWSAAAALAALTSRIEIIAEIKPYLVNPVMLAKMALQIETISRGRFAINVVDAWDRHEINRAGIGFVGHEERYDYGHDWMSVVKPLLYGARVSYAGMHFSVHDCKLGPSGYRPRPMIYIDGNTETGRLLAAEAADTVFIHALPSSPVKHFIATMASRPRSGTPLRYALSAFVVTRAADDAAEAAYAQLKTLPAKDGAPSKIRDCNVDSKVVSISNRTRRYLSGGGDDGIATGLVGSYDKVAERMIEFWTAGIELFTLQFQPFETEMERFANEIIPRVRRLTSRSSSVSSVKGNLIDDARSTMRLLDFQRQN